MVKYQKVLFLFRDPSLKPFCLLHLSCLWWPFSIFCADSFLESNPNNHVSLQCVHFPLSLAFLSRQHFLFACFVRLSQDKNSTKSCLDPSPENRFNRPIRVRDRSQRSHYGKPEQRPRPPVSHSLFYVLDALQIEHHPPTLSSHFVKWRVQERRESGNRQENYVHRVYGGDGEKEIEIKYPCWWDRGF